jgi:hypothetical protein
VKVLLLGAGASAATLGEDIAPVSAKFGKTLNDKHSHWVHRFPFLRSAVDYLRSGVIDDWPLNAVWNGIDENYKLSHVIANDSYEWPSLPTMSKRLYSHYEHRSWASFWILAGWELKRALAEVYGTALKPFLTRTLLESKWLSKQITALEDQDVIASTNYDLLTENIVGLRWPGTWNCLINSELQSRRPTQGPLVLKLHGSLDWRFCSNSITKMHRVDRTLPGSPIGDDEIDLNQNFWETRPLVVAPVRYKDEIVFPGAQPDELVEVLTFQWKMFVEALSRADELHVLGYRFPPEDSYGNRMLKEAMRRRPVSKILRIRLYLPNEPPSYECRDCKTRLEKDIFPAAPAEVQCCEKIPS